MYVEQKGSRMFKDIPFRIKDIRLVANLKANFQVINTNIF